MTIRDDAPSERRRRSIEVLEERARTLGAALAVEHDDDGHDDAARAARSTPPPSRIRAAHELSPLRLEAVRLRAARAATATPPAVGAEVEQDGEMLRVAKVAPVAAARRQAAVRVPGDG